VKVYISGVISKGGTLSEDEINRNLARFEAARVVLLNQGHEPWSPVHHIPENGKPSTDYASWVAYMRQDIAALVGCDAIFMIPGWEESRGARLEVHVARELGFVEL
jgi:uncharacterized protein DUF4406